MATASSVVNSVDVGLDKLTGEFDISSVVAFNLINLGRLVVNSSENVFNFCCELKLLSNKHSCPGCR